MAAEEFNPTPFSMVMTELWNMLRAHPGFVRDVPERNQIRFDSQTDRDPMKETSASADSPEVAIVSSAVSANLNETSSTSRCSRQYSIMVSTGDLRYAAKLAPIEWDIFTSLLSWKTRLAALQWKKKNFCKVLRLVSAGVIASTMDQLQQKKMFGWNAVWTVEVEMHFATADLLTELPASDNTGNN